MNHERTLQTQEVAENEVTVAGFAVQTQVYDPTEKDLRHEDQANGRGRADNLVGRLKDFDASAIYIVPGCDGNERPMRLTGRVEVNPHHSFSPHGNQPIDTYLVEVVDVISTGVNEDGTTSNHSRKWISNAELQDYEQLAFDDRSQQSTTHQMGAMALHASGSI